MSYGSPLSEGQVRDLLEMSSDERALELARHIVSKSVQEGLTVINLVAGDGVDLRQFHRGVMEYLRGVLLLKSGTEASLGYPEETIAELRSLADQVTLDHIVRAMKTFAMADVRRDSSSPLPLELALVESSLDEQVEQRPPAPQAVGTARVAGTPMHQAVPTVSAAPTVRAAATPRAPDTPTGPVDSPGADSIRERPSEDQPSDPSQRLESRWDEFVSSFRQYKGKRFNLGALLRSCTDREVADGTITLKYSHPSHQERMQEELDHPQEPKGASRRGGQGHGRRL